MNGNCITGDGEHLVIPALPYFDRDYDSPEARQAVARLLEEETNRYRPAKNYLGESRLPQPPARPEEFETGIVTQELNRLRLGQPMREHLDMRRYELPGPPAGRMNDVQAWQECADNSDAQRESQELRLANLEMMVRYDPEAWKRTLEASTRRAQDLERQLEEEMRREQETNWNRKNEHLDAGSRLDQLEESWVAMVTKNFELESTVLEMEREISELEAELGM